MAHIIEFPVSFEFGILPQTWDRATLQIYGWEQREDGDIDGDNLKANIVSSSIKGTVTYPTQNLPFKEWEACLEASTNEEARNACAGFTPEVLMCADPPRYISSSAWPRVVQIADAWEMRDEFLRMGGRSDDVLAFLNRWGTWNIHRYLFASEVLREQTIIREALTKGPQKWLEGGYSFPQQWIGQFTRRPQFPYYFVRAFYCQVALNMTVASDVLQRTRFRVCARRDCGVPFAITSKHARKFCSQYCGHLESVRKQRREAKRAARRKV